MAGESSEGGGFEPKEKKDITFTEAFKKVAKDNRLDAGIGIVLYGAIAWYTGHYELIPIGVFSDTMKYAYDAHKYKTDVNEPAAGKRGFLKEQFGKALSLGAFAGGIGLFVVAAAPTVASVAAWIGFGMAASYTISYLFGDKNKNEKSGEPPVPQMP